MVSSPRRLHVRCTCAHPLVTRPPKSQRRPKAYAARVLFPEGGGDIDPGEEDMEEGVGEERREGEQETMMPPPPRPSFKSRRSEIEQLMIDASIDITLSRAERRRAPNAAAGAGDDARGAGEERGGSEEEGEGRRGRGGRRSPALPEASNDEGLLVLPLAPSPARRAPAPPRPSPARPREASSPRRPGTAPPAAVPHFSLPPQALPRPSRSPGRAAEGAKRKPSGLTARSRASCPRPGLAPAAVASRGPPRPRGRPGAPGACGAPPAPPRAASAPSAPRSARGRGDPGRRRRPAPGDSWRGGAGRASVGSSFLAGLGPLDCGPGSDAEAACDLLGFAASLPNSAAPSPLPGARPDAERETPAGRPEAAAARLLATPPLPTPIATPPFCPSPGPLLAGGGAGRAPGGLLPGAGGGRACGGGERLPAARRSARRGGPRARARAAGAARGGRPRRRLVAPPPQHQRRRLPGAPAPRPRGPPREASPTVPGTAARPAREPPASEAAAALVEEERMEEEEEEEEYGAAACVLPLGPAVPLRTLPPLMPPLPSSRVHSGALVAPLARRERPGAARRHGHGPGPGGGERHAPLRQKPPAPRLPAPAHWAPAPIPLRDAAPRSQPPAAFAPATKEAEAGWAAGPGGRGLVPLPIPLEALREHGLLPPEPGAPPAPSGPRPDPAPPPAPAALRPGPTPAPARAREQGRAWQGRRRRTSLEGWRGLERRAAARAAAALGRPRRPPARGLRPGGPSPRAPFAAGPPFCSALGPT
eukprot:tig00000865_g5113.t1